MNHKIGQPENTIKNIETEKNCAKINVEKKTQRKINLMNLNIAENPAKHFSFKGEKRLGCAGWKWFIKRFSHA